MLQMISFVTQFRGRIALLFTGHRHSRSFCARQLEASHRRPWQIGFRFSGSPRPEPPASGSRSPQGSSAPRRRSREGVHARPRSRCNRPPLRSPPRLPRQRQPSPGIRHRRHTGNGNVEDGCWSTVSPAVSRPSICRSSTSSTPTSVGTATTPPTVASPMTASKLYAIVAQISRRKPLLKKILDGQTIPENAATDSACPTPAWQRSPSRVTFEPAGAAKQTFAIRGHTVDLIIESEEPESEEASK